MFQDITKSIDACAANYGEDREAMKQYLIQGQGTALAMPNRGPARFGSDGQLDEVIRQAYSKYGFYIFERVVSDEELKDLEAEEE